MSHNIKIYTITHSEHCHLAIYWLKSHNIKFDEVKLDEDDDGKEELMTTAGQLSVPALIIEDNGEKRIIIGFEPDEYEANLLKE